MAMNTTLRKDASAFFSVIQKQQKKMADELRRRQSKSGTKIV